MLWRYPSALHGQRAAQGAAAQERQRRRLGDGRIRHAATLDAHALRPRSRARQANRPHAGNPTPDRPGNAFGVRSGCAGRIHHPPRLRRAPGRRRHPHRGDLGRLGCAAPRGQHFARQWQAHRRPDSAKGRGGQLRHPPGHARPRPRLSRGFRGGCGRQFRPARKRQHRRGTGDRGTRHL